MLTDRRTPLSSVGVCSPCSSWAVDVDGRVGMLGLEAV